MKGVNKVQHNSNTVTRCYYSGRVEMRMKKEKKKTFTVCCNSLVAYYSFSFFFCFFLFDLITRTLP